MNELESSNLVAQILPFHPQNQKLAPSQRFKTFSDTNYALEDSLMLGIMKPIIFARSLDTVWRDFVCTGLGLEKEIDSARNDDKASFANDFGM